MGYTLDSDMQAKASKVEAIWQFVKFGVSWTAIEKITGIPRSTLYNFMQTRRLRTSVYFNTNLARTPSGIIVGDPD